MRQYHLSRHAPTRRQVRSRTGKTLRHQANWRLMADDSRYDFPVTVRRVQPIKNEEASV